MISRVRATRGHVAAQQAGQLHVEPELFGKQEADEEDHQDRALHQAAGLPGHGAQVARHVDAAHRAQDRGLDFGAHPRKKIGHRLGRAFGIGQRRGQHRVDLRQDQRSHHEQPGGDQQHGGDAGQPCRNARRPDPHPRNVVDRVAGQAEQDDRYGERGQQEPRLDKHKQNDPACDDDERGGLHAVARRALLRGGGLARGVCHGKDIAWRRLRSQGLSDHGPVATAPALVARTARR